MTAPNRATALTAGLAGLTLTLAACGPGDTTVTRSTFKDTAGRVCTQLVADGKVALDCDWPPADVRLGDALHDLLTPTPTRT